MALGARPETDRLDTRKKGEPPGRRKKREPTVAAVNFSQEARVALLAVEGMTL